MSPYIYAGVEGDLDAAVATRLVTDAGASIAGIHGRRGKVRLLEQLGGFNAAAKHAPWLVLIDLDDDKDCAPPARKHWLPSPAALMCFRIVIPEIEAWLLADRARFASFLGVASRRLPADPESVPDPKSLVVRLAARSRSRRIREALVPDPASRRKVGPGYTGHLIEFAGSRWQPDAAASRSESLARCLRRLATLVETPKARS